MAVSTEVICALIAGACTVLTALAERRSRVSGKRMEGPG